MIGIDRIQTCGYHEKSRKKKERKKTNAINQYEHTESLIRKTKENQEQNTKHKISKKRQY